MINIRPVIFIFLMCLFLINSHAQTITGFVSRKPVSTAENCGCSGCNDAAYAAGVDYPDVNGACGTTEPSAGTGNCTNSSRSAVIVIPAGCTVTVSGGVGDRTGCSGSGSGAGLDAGDQFSIVGSLGTTNCNSGIQAAGGNSSVFVGPLTQVGGQVTFNLTSNRVSELLTYTIVYSAIGCTPSPLPLQLLSFTADVDDGAVNLKWTTASEKNVLGFDIEYSFDAINFYKESNVSAAGNIYDVNHYQKIMANQFNTSNVYFRLKLINKDETYSYSPILSLKDVNNEDWVLSPNPTCTGDVMVMPGKRKTQASVLKIINSMGNCIYEAPLTSQEEHIDLKKYGKGIYFFYQLNNERATFKKVIYN